VVMTAKIIVLFACSRETRILRGHTSNLTPLRLPHVRLPDFPFGMNPGHRGLLF
jgi:hypothetical protein